MSWEDEVGVGLRESCEEGPAMRERVLRSAENVSEDLVDERTCFGPHSGTASLSGSVTLAFAETAGATRGIIRDD